jgi:hypothetical protein
MDYDFSVLCRDQLDRLNKRLESTHKSFVKEYKLALGVINNSNVNSHWDEIVTEVNNLLSDQVNKCEITYTETFNKVQRVLGKYL